ncbi:Piso0_005838 [Millerozyma farinosa CBS 7064]|uniref:Piso0_005838 protein n=1 Tax=Pichia sorbitophila (strain ATCC MYA-4447 / BCRC 22081 / CBS 7064 / NBRC 10061 / NRRL Y-12695) TaxID=559304 RepID=G8Y031_PICSO|nr:Piso0_005838 [Millerozyma farinosa CBS 7064]
MEPKEEVKEANPSQESGVEENGRIDGQMQSDVGTLSPKARYVPPLNFSLVEDGIYRSGFPMPINYPFLEQLGLKTIIYLGDLGHDKKKSKPSSTDKSGAEAKSKKDKDKSDKHAAGEIWQDYQRWIETTDIKFFNLLMESSQEPFIMDSEHKQSEEALTRALQLILDRRNFPILIHSNKGKHRIGVLVGLMRKILQGWSMSGIFDEYEKFAMGKAEYDLEFIELWQPELYVNVENKPDFLRL